MRLLYTLIFCLSNFLLFADGMTVSGTIKDEDSKSALAGATVTVTFFQGMKYSSITDSAGNYLIQTNIIIPDGNYSLQISAPNYYTLNGFIHVTKNSRFQFTLKQKAPPVKQEITIIETPKPVLEGFATNNLVFLIDISSSMNAPEKLPLLKESMKYLVNELRATDKVAILTFSKSVQEVLSSTSASNKELINKTIDDLTFGSTSQGGIALDVAYKTALNNYIEKGNNRIVLTSDGLFTSGEKDYAKMQQRIESGLDKNISLSIFCFGKTTEYVNSKLKRLSSTGNGNYAVISSLEEGKQHMLMEAKAVKEP